MADHSLVLDAPPPFWSVENFSDICTRVQDTAWPSTDGERLYLGLEHLAPGFPAIAGRGRESDVRSGKTSFRKGDVLFGKLRPYLRKSALADDEGICSTDILVFRSTGKCIPEFLCFLTHTDQFVGHAKATTSGVQHPRTSWTSLRNFRLHLPPLSEQRNIAAVLGLVQRAIEQQERMIALTTELKKALMHKLFTEGLRGEPQKQTEIGPVPGSWAVSRLGDFLIEAQYGLSIRGSNTGRYALLRMTNQQEGRISPDNLQFVELTSQQFKKFRVERGDILFNRTNSLDLVGRTAIFDLDGNFVFASYLIRLRTDTSRLRPHFLNHYLNWDESQVRLKSIASRAVSQSNISATRLRGFPIPVPLTQEQDEIVEKVDGIDRKIALHRCKHSALTDLFRTLLHQLMTAQIRVHDLDLSGLEKMVVNR
jgi:type I restriction enzyme S subunit